MQRGNTNKKDTEASSTAATQSTSPSAKSSSGSVTVAAGSTATRGKKNESWKEAILGWHLKYAMLTSSGNFAMSWWEQAIKDTLVLSVLVSLLSFLVWVTVIFLRALLS